ncbi:growth-regulating factor 4 isoform X2 [Elaeis guineensis]|uniref:Growth-regulating factor n=1 Tax=Elaeis guineensis var. tenera TaxID=51953 RepID=A0A6I9SHX9_ELAGV|nr:growth-regulating factor 4 [Elaeis guineensis]
MNSAAAAAGWRPPFTASQWQELEHQALIFKYIMAGVPVPPDLLIPIRRSFEAAPARFYHHPALGYCSFYGKKLDPEPGRCRRTDGKKWRCSKDAYPDSKYCERHMHRGRNRSRKPVESQTLSQSQSSSSTVTSLAPSGSSASRSGSGSFQSIPLHSISGGSNLQGSYPGGTISSQLHMDPHSYGIRSSGSSRYLSGLKGEVDEHSFFSEASGSARGLGMDSSVDSSWRLMPSGISSFPLSKSRDPSVLQSAGAYPSLQSVQDLGQVTISSLPKHQQQHSFFGSDFGSAEPVKHEGGSQSLRPFFDEWPKTRDSWSDLEEERSNRISFSTTQLSISIPMASSDFSTSSSRSPNDD